MFQFRHGTHKRLRQEGVGQCLLIGSRRNIVRIQIVVDIYETEYQTLASIAPHDHVFFKEVSLFLLIQFKEIFCTCTTQEASCARTFDKQTNTSSNHHEKRKQQERIDEMLGLHIILKYIFTVRLYMQSVPHWLCICVACITSLYKQASSVHLYLVIQYTTFLSTWYQSSGFESPYS